MASDFVLTNANISTSSVVRTWLAEFSAKGTTRLRRFNLIRCIYWDLLTWVMAAEFPTSEIRVTTNMDAPLGGEGISTDIPVTVVDIMRAGMLPTAVCHEILLTAGIHENLVHEHHILAARRTDDAGRVIGVDIDDSKAYEPIRDGSIVIFPDPMLATGTTLAGIISRYKQKHPGLVRKYIVVSMIATPMGIQAIHALHPEVIIYAGRLDPELTEQGYIVPGAGGVGELLTGTKK